MAERQALHAYMSPKAHNAWQSFAEENGVSVTGLLESLGLDLAEEIAAAGNDPADVRREWVKRGRKIDAARRRRGREAA